MEERPHYGPMEKRGVPDRDLIAWKKHFFATDKSKTGLCILHEYIVEEYYQDSDPAKYKAKIHWPPIVELMRNFHSTFPGVILYRNGEQVPVEEMRRSILSGRWVNFYHNARNKVNNFTRNDPENPRLCLPEYLPAARTWLRNYV